MGSLAWLDAAGLALYVSGCANVFVDGSSETSGPGGSTGSSPSGGCSDLASCFQLAPALDVDSGAHDLIVVDCDGDRHQDIVVANDESATISVLRGHGDGTFDPRGTFDAGKSPWLLAAADFNGDGAIDLVVANFVHGASLLLGDGKCGFGAPVQVLSDDPLGQYSGGALSVAAGDLDGDGYADIVAQVSGPGGRPPYLGVFFGHGDGTFEPPAFVPTESDASRLVIADLNGDGVNDVVGVWSWLAMGGTPAASVVLGLGGRAFAAPVAYPIDRDSNDVIVADLDGDGALDLAVSCGTANVGVLRGRGDGTFGPQERFPEGGSADGMAVGDLDGDGVPDLVIALSSKNEVGILRGLGGGRFDAPIAITTGHYSTNGGYQQPYYVKLADVDEDGKLDIAATDYAGYVSLLLTAH